MMDALRTWLVGIDPVVGLLAKATVLLALAWAADLILMRANPRWRVLLWRGTAVALATLPLLMLVLPAVRIEVAAPPPALAAVQAPAGVAAAGGQAAGASRLVVQAGPWLVGALWVLGLFTAAGRTALGHRRIRRLLDSSRPLPAEAAMAFRAVATGIHCRRPVRFRAMAGAGSPVLVGLWRPTVLMPDAILDGAERRDLEGVVAHELAHVRSHDLRWAYALHWLSALLWFHPLAWGMGRAHGRACELVSDADSAGYVGSGRAYARTLARVAVGMRAPQPTPVGVALAGGSELGGRLAALRRGGSAGRLPVAQMLAAWVVGGAFLAVLSAMVVACSTTGRLPAAPGAQSAAVGQAGSGETASPSVAPVGQVGPRVTLVSPYAPSYTGAPTDKISVQYAVIEMARQAGLGYDWKTSYANTDPLCRRWTLPELRDVPWPDAMASLLEPLGLTYSVKDGMVTLARKPEGPAGP